MTAVSSSKNKNKNFKNQRGFSLVELMIVVSIIGVLAALAIPRFQKFQARARQAEAKSNLGHIFTLQEAYYGDHDAYGTIPTAIGANTNCSSTNDLGFKPEPCAQSRYGYTSTGGATFTATATSGTGASNLVFPGCSTADQWTINQTKVLTDVNTAIQNC